MFFAHSFKLVLYLKLTCSIIGVFKAGKVGKVYASKKTCYLSCPGKYRLPKIPISYIRVCGCQLEKSIVFLMFSIYLTGMLPFTYYNYDHLSAASNKTSKLSQQYDLANELIQLQLEVTVSRCSIQLEGHYLKMHVFDK